MSHKKVAAVTITFNRLELTKKTLESFNSKTSVDYHLFVDNGSTDGTKEFLKDYFHIPLEKNFGIARAFAYGVKALTNDYDYILKLDNDIETVTDDIIDRMIKFYERSGELFAASPVDLLIDPNFYPAILKRVRLNEHNIEYVSHTGGAFQLAPAKYVRQLCSEFYHLSKGDYMIGNYYRRIGVAPIYIKDFEMKHIGLNQSTPGDKYIM